MIISVIWGTQQLLPRFLIDFITLNQIFIDLSYHVSASKAESEESMKTLAYVVYISVFTLNLAKKSLVNYVEWLNEIFLPFCKSLILIVDAVDGV